FVRKFRARFARVRGAVSQDRRATIWASLICRFPVKWPFSASRAERCALGVKDGMGILGVPRLLGGSVGQGDQDQRREIARKHPRQVSLRASACMMKFVPDEYTPDG